MASYCAVCGGTLSDGANFCSGCGKAVNHPASPAAAAVRPLLRPKAGRKLGGVCLGLAQHFNWDISYVRIIVVLFTILTIPVGLIAYAICWVVIPEEPSAIPVISTLTPTA